MYPLSFRQVGWISFKGLFGLVIAQQVYHPANNTSLEINTSASFF
jgi:hypothetical protein